MPSGRSICAVKVIPTVHICIALSMEGIIRVHWSSVQYTHSQQSHYVYMYILIRVGLYICVRVYKRTTHMQSLDSRMTVYT